MRIIAGTHRGRKLAGVGKGDMQAHLRPTTDRVRESLFSVLSHQHELDGARVLDLFAGTGALGLEALSRGASQVTFVDDGRAAGALIRKNIDLLGCGKDTSLQRRDATRIGPNTDDPFDLVFLDPPYGKNLGQKALTAARNGGWLDENVLIVWEENAPMTSPEGFVETDSRRYGDTYVTFLTLA